MRSCVLPFALLALPLLAVPSRAVGAGLDFRATLTPIRIEARPGQVANREFRLTLAPEAPATRFKTHVQDWWPSEDGRQSFYREPGTLARSCGPWVSLNPREETVPAGGTLSVRVSVAVPADAEAAGYWCVLSVDEVEGAAPEVEGVGVRFLASVSVGIFVSLGPVEKVARITGFELSGDAARVTVWNDGNGPLGVEGWVEFWRPGDGQPTARATLPRRTLVTEPISSGSLFAALPTADILPGGRYLVRAIVDIGADHYIGVEKELEVRRGNAKTGR